MKFCQKCGKQLMDEAFICPGCGCAVGVEGMKMQRAAEENGGLATSAVVFAFLVPIVGLILALIGLSKYTDETYRKKCSSAIMISIGVFIVCFFLIMAAGSL